MRFDSFLPARELGERIDACGGTAIVAFKDPTLNRGWYLGRSYISEAEFENGRARVFSEVRGVYDVTPEHVPGGIITGPSDDWRPQRIARITRFDAIEQLREHPSVDYIEPSCPNDIQFFTAMGCWGAGSLGILSMPADEAGADAREKSTLMPSGDWAPWSYRELGVFSAWNYLEQKGQRPGSLVTIGIVDTGLVETEPEFTTEFVAAKGLAPVTGFAAPLGNPFDVCDHGTRMASFATAPENGKMMLGVAKDALLETSRIGDGVVHLTAGRQEIGSEIERVSNTSQVVTLAWGMPLGSQTIADSIQKTQRDTEVVLLAAAGTLVPFGASFFPATMENETISVTAIAPQRGSPTDFVRLPAGPLWQVAYNPGVDVLGIASVDNAAGPSIGLNTGRFAIFGGSSAAVAQLAGVFAMSASSFNARFGRFPTRNELVNRVLSFAFQGDTLRNETFHGGRSADVGLGLVNVFAAVGGLVSVGIDGTRSTLPGQPFTLSARPVGDGPFSYQWRISGNPAVIATGQNANFTIPQSNTTTSYSVTVIEPATGHSKVAFTTVSTVPTHERVLFARDFVSSFSSFLDGHRIDRMINEDLATRRGCNVREVLAQEYVKNSAGQIVPLGAPVASADFGSRGFTVTRPHTWFSNQQTMPPEGLTVLVHAWHDGLSSVRVRPVYVFDEPNGVDCLTGVLQASP